MSLKNCQGVSEEEQLLLANIRGGRYSSRVF